ncbi:hypothetical protein FRC00_008568 [Tulasnella sp. 408]|nr:hypothetical protein FRC00_008568 [Tulasnella sp. 408]
MHLTYFAQAFPTPGQMGSEDEVNTGSDRNRPTHFTLPTQRPQADFTQNTQESRFSHSEIVPTPAMACASGSPSEAAPINAPAMPAYSHSSNKQKQRANTSTHTTPSPSGPNTVRPVMHQDPGPSIFGSLMATRASASRYPPSKPLSSSSESYGSWTTDEAAEAHAITAKFEELEIEKGTEALSQKRVGSTTDRMDIVQHEDLE